MRSFDLDNYLNGDTIAVAISYSGRAQKREIAALKNLIKSFNRRQLYNLEVYYDDLDRKGTIFSKIIPERFEAADIIICLVSYNFIYNNDFVYDIERPIIQSKYNLYEDAVTIVPIIVSRTSNYTTSWLGTLNLKTLPSNNVNKSIRSFPDISYPMEEIKAELHNIFLDFHNNVIDTKRRVNFKENFRTEHKAVNKNLYLAIIAVVITGLLAYAIIASSPTRTQPTNTPLNRTPPVNAPPTGNPPVNTPPNRTPPVNSPSTGKPPANTPPNRTPPVNKSPSGKPPVNTPPTRTPPAISPLDIIATDLAINLCQDKGNTNSVFPRKLSDYRYYGKERYGRYESCQGINAEGFKPCKKNRRWYIVNEQLNIHTILDITERMHKDIYAIRPLHNGIAEVYEYKNNSLNLSYCITIENGKVYK